MNIAVVDDMPLETERLTYVINEYMSENQVNSKISVFQSAENLLAGYRPHQYTMIFLDIYMKGMTGIDAAKKIRDVDNDTLIIFLTSSPEHTFDAFDVHAFQYILKNPDDKAFKEAVCRVLKDILSLHGEITDCLSFSVEGKEERVMFSDIIYAQSQKNYIQLTAAEASHRFRMTFSDLNTRLSKDSRFLQINRGIIVNMDHITSFGKEGCELTGGYNLPVNVREQKKLDQIRRNYVFSKLHNK